MPLCYKDRAWCTAKCNTHNCPRNVTEKVIQEAKEFGLSISYMDFSRCCPEYTGPEPKEHWTNMKGIEE